MSARIAALLIATLGWCIHLTAPEPDWRWLDAARAQAFDRFLPVSADPDLLVGYRSYRDLYQDVPERYLRVERAPSATRGADGFVATLVVPVRRSIQQQLLDLHRSRPRASVDALLADVAVRRTTISSTRCPSLTSSLDVLSGVSITIPKRDLIVLHPNVHYIVLHLGTLSMDATLFDDDAPLVRWVAEARAAVERCNAA